MQSDIALAETHKRVKDHYLNYTNMDNQPTHKRYPISEIRRYYLEARKIACKAAEGMTLEQARQQQETLPEFRLRAEQRRNAAASSPQSTD